MKPDKSLWRLLYWHSDGEMYKRGIENERRDCITLLTSLHGGIFDTDAEGTDQYERKNCYEVGHNLTSAPGLFDLSGRS